MAKWAVRITSDEAINDTASLFNNENIKSEVGRIMRLLAQQDDPRSPKAESGLIVDELIHDSPGWFRVKVPRYGIRVIFRLLIIQDEQIIEIKSDKPIPEADNIENYIDVMQIQ